MPLLKHNSAQIHYEYSELKGAPVLLLLHGGFGSVEDFSLIYETLSKKFNIVSIDSRGQGRSTLGEEGLSYQHLQEDVEAVLKKLGISKLSILGYSDGGIVAYRLAVYTDLDIDWIITIGSRWHVKQTDRFQSLLTSLDGASWKAMFPEKYQNYQHLNPEPDYDKLTKTYVKMCLDGAATGHPNEQISSMNCPVLAIRGQNDEVVTELENKELASLSPCTTLITMKDVGHGAHIEAPDAVLESIVKFTS